MARPMKLTPVQQNELDQIKSVINITPDDLLEDVKESMRVALRNRRDTASIMLGYLDGVTYSTEDRKVSKVSKVSKGRGKEAAGRRGRPAKAQAQVKAKVTADAKATKSAAKPGKRVLSKEARARIVEAQRKRWAKVRKEAKAKASAKTSAKAAKKSGKVKEIAKAA